MKKRLEQRWNQGGWIEAAGRLAELAHPGTTDDRRRRTAAVAEAMAVENSFRINVTYTIPVK